MTLLEVTEPLAFLENHDMLSQNFELLEMANQNFEGFEILSQSLFLISAQQHDLAEKTQLARSKMTEVYTSQLLAMYIV